MAGLTCGHIFVDISAIERGGGCLCALFLNMDGVCDSSTSQVQWQVLSFEVVYHVEIGSWNKVPQLEHLGRKKKDLKE